MSIQSNINHTLSIASLLFTQNPMVKEAAEKRSQEQATQKEISKLEKQKSIAHEEYLKQRPKLSEEDISKEASSKSLQEGASMLGERAGMQADIAMNARNLFDINPTAEYYQEYQSALKAEKNLTKLKNLFLKEASAKDALTAAQEERRAGRVVTEDISELPTSYGISVGELGPSAQAYIAEQFKKGEK